MDRSRASFSISLLFSFLAVIVAILLAPSRIYSVVYDSAFRLYSGITSSPLTDQKRISSVNPSRTPIYFISHGGPNIMYDVFHPVYSKLQEIGREITQQVKPRAVVVFSAHWQGKSDVIEVNTAETTDIIYDFYGFPAKHYKEIYPNRGSKEVAEKVIDLLSEAGIKTEARSRGLDHGVWAAFRVAFNPEENPLNVPIVEVSLFDTEDPDQHYNLGRAVAPLRSENIQIIVSGMAVHNLQEMQLGILSGKPLPYATSFDNALKDAATAAPDGRQAKLVALLDRKDARKAHPTFDHLLPIFVGAGAAGDDRGVRLWTLTEGSMSWAQYRFGDVPLPA